MMINKTSAENAEETSAERLERIRKLTEGTYYGALGAQAPRDVRWLVEIANRYDEVLKWAWQLTGDGPEIVQNCPYCTPEIIQDSGPTEWRHAKDCPYQNLKERSRPPVRCPFCEYAGPSQVLTEDAFSYIVEPINPVVPGHLLVVAKAHLRSAAVVPVTTGRVMEMAAYWVQIQGGDWNIITSIGEAATQTVDHLHVHLVPRHPGDGLPLPWAPLG